jgi:HrpA-like RNA helicase
MEKEIGILDPEGKNKNPLNTNDYSENYKILAKKWSNLPTYKKAKDIINMIGENNILLIQSGTGSGKSVIIPKLLLHTLNYEKKIIMILPKQLLTEASAKYAAETLDVELGDEIGYKYRGEKKYSSNTKILYTTDGTLVSMLMKDPELKNYSGILLDEAHERRTQTDFLLYLLKQTCIARKDFKLIIMSATVNQNIFADYFSGLKYNNVDISGKTNYPIVSTYLNQPIDKTKYIEKGVEIIEYILKTTKDGDILFFVPTIQETFSGCKKFTNNKDDYCVEVFAGMNKENEKLAIDKELYKTKTKKTRKIIIATNVAESSMTIDGIKYVIDSGYEIFGYFNPELESKVIEKRLITKAQIKQRMGRAGRTSDGYCYHLYTKKQYESLEEYPKPAIQTSNIYSECLSLLNLEIIQNTDNLKKVLNNFIEPPQDTYVNYSIKNLSKLGLITNGKISSLGKKIVKLPTEPSPGLAIYNGYGLNCHNEIMMIISMSEVIKNNISELFMRPSEENKILYDKYIKAKHNLKQNGSDHYSLFKILEKYEELKESSDEDLKEWIKSNFLKIEILKKAYKYYQKMKDNSTEILKETYVKLDISNNDYELKDKILASMMTGYHMNVISKSNGHYKTNKIKKIKINRDSWISNDDNDKIMYTELFTSGYVTNMQLCSNISDDVKRIYENIE